MEKIPTADNNNLHYMTLQSKDGESFLVPTSVLASKSTLVKNILKHGSEEEKNLIKFPEIASDVLQVIVEWVKDPNTLKLCMDTFQDILIASEYLNCSQLSDDVKKWIFSNVDLPDNIVTLLKFSQGSQILDLEKQAHDYLTSNINDVSTQELLSMSFQDLLTLLSSNEISCTEEELWFTVIKLVQELSDAKESLELLDCVRFGLMCHDFVKMYVMTESKAREYFLSRFGTDQVTPGLMASLRSTQSSPRTPSEVVLAFGWIFGADITNTISVYDPTKRKWADPKTAFSSGWICNGAVLFGSNVYLCGGLWGGEPLPQLIRLNLQSMQFESLSRTNKRRVNFCMSIFEGSIYVIGGSNNDYGPQNSAEKYDIEENKWYDIEPMLKRRQGACAATVKSIIYVAGGIGPDGCDDSVEAYNTKTGRWTMVEPMGVKRYQAKAVELNGKLFVVGGKNGLRGPCHKSGECYDPAKRSWERLPDMGYARYSCSLTVVNGQLFVSGGVDDDGKEITRSEYLNKFTNTWVEVGSWKSYMTFAIFSVPVKELGEEITGSLEKISSLKDSGETST